MEGYIDENILSEKLENHEINSLEYINHHSENMKKEFKEFCLKNNYPMNVISASEFLESLLLE